MLDAENITNFNASNKELEALLVFWVCAAGKNGVTTANCLNKLFDSWKNFNSPFEAIRKLGQNKTKEALRSHGIGCFNIRSKTLTQLANSNLNLKTCSVDDLETVFGIGPKTSRCFIIHSRPNQKLAGLDVHILRFLSDSGYSVPKITPSSKKKYKQIEEFFLNEVVKSGQTVAEFDLKIWNEYRNKDIK